MFVFITRKTSTRINRNNKHTGTTNILCHTVCRYYKKKRETKEKRNMVCYEVLKKPNKHKCS